MAKDLLWFYFPMKVVRAIFILAGENPPPLALNDSPMITLNERPL